MTTTRNPVKKKKKKGLSKANKNLLIDAAISLGFLATFAQEITGQTLHEWLAMALFVGLTTHLALHWSWVVGITKKIFSAKLPWRTRVNYVLNIGLFACFGLIGLSGMMISEVILPPFGLGNGPGLWEDLHEAFSNLSMLLVGGHVALHAKWIINTTKTALFGKPKKTRKAPRRKPVPA